MGLYKETVLKKSVAAAILCIAFLVIYWPWFSSNRELFREESLFAVETVEFGKNIFQVTAHSAPVLTAAPLFPAVCKFFWEITGLPIEFIMRSISILMLAFGGILVYFAAASQREPKAGWVASAFYLTSLIALEKAVDGNPATMSAFFLFAAQLIFFYYGIRRSNWNKAWIFSAVFLALSFLSGGITMLIFFIAPMFFFRRPLSVRSKFSVPGFAVAVLLLAGVVALWTVPQFARSGETLYDIWLDSVLFYKRKYFLELLEFPLMLPLRLMPWTLIAWLPFCVALQDLDKTPIFSRYLRTLLFVTLAIVWIFNDSESRMILFLIGPWSILTGITYELGTRRYGERIRKCLPLGVMLAAGLAAVYLAIALASAYLAVWIAPEKTLSGFVRVTRSLAFMKEPVFLVFASVGSSLLLLLAVIMHIFRKRHPLWMMLLLVSVSCGIFYGGVMNPYRAGKQAKRRLGTDIKNVLLPAGGHKLYKLGINDLYGELYYSGAEVIKLHSIKDIPPDEPVVFLIGTEFPGTTDRSWVNLLPPDYTYNRHPLLLWKGVLRQSDD